MSLAPSCPPDWESCAICGAAPEEPCLNKDVYEMLLSFEHERECMDQDTAPEQPSSISPSHYSRHAIEPIDFIELNNLGFSAGNAIKYICRYDAKNGLEDLYKAKRYVEFLIQKELGEAPSTARD